MKDLLPTKRGIAALLIIGLLLPLTADLILNLYLTREHRAFSITGFLVRGYLVILVFWLCYLLITAVFQRLRLLFRKHRK